MIYIFDREEQLSAVLDNSNKKACPILSASFEEVLNGESILEFSIPSTHSAVTKILDNGFSAIKKENGEFELFIINNIEDLHEEKIEKNITCHHAIREIEDDYIDELLIDRKAAAEALGNILAYTRWELGNVSGSLTEVHDLTVRRGNALDALQTFITRWNVEISYRFDFDGGKISKRYIDLHAERGQDAGRRFEFGKDIKSFTRSINTQGLKTALYGYASIGVTTNEATGEGEEQLLDFSDVVWSKANGDEYDKPAGQKWIGNEEARAKYGRIDIDGTRRHLFGTHNAQQQAAAVESNNMTSEELLHETAELLNDLSSPKIIYEGKVIDYAKITNRNYAAIALGDTTGLIDRELEEFLKARIIKYKRDLLNKENNDITLGNFVPTLTDDTSEARLAAEQAQKTATFAEHKAESPEIVREGDVIKTDWLEDEINLITKKIRAGEGTVTIEDNNGILIEDIDLDANGNITARRGALRLKAGMLSLADTYNESIGDYNWSAFGTGEGFLSDLVKTGFIRFDRAKGGILQLGGEVVGVTEDGKKSYENGVLLLYSSTPEQGEIARLDGDYGGFGQLRIDRVLDADNLVYKSTSDIRKYWYVDPNDGNDSNEGSEEAPRQTIQSCLDALPKYLNENIYIYFVPTLLFDNEINIDGFIGKGNLFLRKWNIDTRIRYIRDYLAGSNANNANHWVEVGGLLNGAWRHAGGNTYPERITLYDAATGQEITDDEFLNSGYASNNDFATSNYAAHNTSNIRPAYIQVYLGGVYAMDFIKSYHYFNDGRTYYGTKIQVSEDLNIWHTIFDSDREGTYAETSGGKQIDVRYGRLRGRFSATNCGIYIEVTDLFIDADGTGLTALYTNRCPFTYIYNCVVLGDPNVSYAVYVQGGSMRFSKSEVNRASNTLILSAYGGMVEVIYAVGGDAPNSVGSHGNAVAACAGTIPTSTNGTKTANGGYLGGAGTTEESGEFTAYVPPPEPTQYTKTWTNSSSKSWRENYSNWYDGSDVLQGEWSGYGRYLGYWYFGSNIRDVVMGTTIKKIRVYVTRQNQSGNSTSTLVLRWHGYGSQPSSTARPTYSSETTSTSISRGESKWIDVTSAFKTAFENGSAWGIGIYTTSYADDHYIRMTTSAKVEITYEK